MVTNTAEGGRTEVVFYTAKSNKYIFFTKICFFLCADYLCEGEDIMCRRPEQVEIVLDRVSLAGFHVLDLRGTTVGSK